MIITTTCGKVEASTARRCGRSTRHPVRARRTPRAPVRAAPWSTTLDATEFGPASLQPPGEVFMAVDMPLSEDCLSLNVWAPEAAVGSATRSAGHGVDPRWRVPPRLGRAHVARAGRSSRRAGDVVVVTVNYRLGALGFLTHPDLADDERRVRQLGRPRSRRRAPVGARRDRRVRRRRRRTSRCSVSRRAAHSCRCSARRGPRPACSAA